MNYKSIGIGMTSGICWALDTILLGFALVILKIPEYVFIVPFLSTFFHDFFSSIWAGIYLITKNQLKDVVKALKTKNGFFIILAALCGGPIGMSGYLFAIQYIGSAYTATISALYPAIGALFSFIILKDKLTKKGMFGLAVAIISTIIIGFTSPENPQNLVIGFACALLCVFGWGMECVICAYGMGDSIDSNVALFIRQTTSWITYLIAIFPFLKAYKYIPVVLSNNKFIVAISVVALVGTISYICYYRAISLIGPVRAMALNITYSAWSIILGILIFHQSVSPWLLVPCALIVLGSVLANIPEKKEV